MNISVPEGTRVFRQTSQPFGYWVFGPGTKYPRGDYRYSLAPDSEVHPSNYTLDRIAYHSEAVEMQLDTDLMLDVGL